MTILLFMCAIQNFNLNRGDLPFWRVSDPPSERLNLFLILLLNFLLNSLLNASSDLCRFAATDCGIACVFFKPPPKFPSHSNAAFLSFWRPFEQTMSKSEYARLREDHGKMMLKCRLQKRLPYITSKKIHRKFTNLQFFTRKPSLLTEESSDCTGILSSVQRRISLLQY